MSASLLNTGSAVSLPFKPLQRSMGRSKNCSTGITCCYNNNNRLNIKAVSGGERMRDNLDDLQRVSKAQAPKKGAATQPQVAPIGLWDRFPTARTVQQMMETMERIMEDPSGYSSTWPSAAMPREDYGGYRRGRTPWEIKEVKNEYKMRFDMPGMTKEDVKVWVEEKMLVVKAEKVRGAESAGSDEDGGADWSPKSYGRYSSRIALPENVEIEKIKAEVRDGVLYISLPKADASSKVVDINVQ